MFPWCRIRTVEGSPLRPRMTLAFAQAPRRSARCPPAPEQVPPLAGGSAGGRAALGSGAATGWVAGAMAAAVPAESPSTFRAASASRTLWSRTELRPTTTSSTAATATEVPTIRLVVVPMARGTPRYCVGVRVVMGGRDLSTPGYRRAIDRSRTGHSA